MLGSKAFKIALLISLTAHAAVLTPWPDFNAVQEDIKPLKNKPIEVSYLEIKIVPKVPSVKETTPPAMAEVKIERKAEKSILVAKTEPVETESPKPNIKLDTAARKIAYVGYYDLIRQKIKYNLFKMYRPRNRQGEVYVEFILGSDGRLKDAQVLNEKSSQSTHLQEVTIKALRQSSPFPPFPEELNDPEINFNVVISFRE